MLQSSPNNTNRRAGSERVPVAHSHRNRICIFVGLRATLFLFGEESDIARQLYFSRPFDKSNGTYSHRYNTFGLFLWAGRWRNVWRGRCAGRGEVMRGGWRAKGWLTGGWRGEGMGGVVNNILGSHDKWRRVGNRQSLSTIKLKFIHWKNSHRQIQQPFINFLEDSAIFMMRRTLDGVVLPSALIKEDKVLWRWWFSARASRRRGLKRRTIMES